MRTAAIWTSRFSSATRRSSPVRIGSLNRFHQFGSIGSATGMLGCGGSGSAFFANQEPGDSHSGDSKFGPTVQAPRASSKAAAGIRFDITLVSVPPPGPPDVRF